MFQLIIICTLSILWLKSVVYSLLVLVDSFVGEILIGYAAIVGACLEFSLNQWVRGLLTEQQRARYDESLTSLELNIIWPLYIIT